MIVLDASVLHPALIDDEATGARARQRLRGEDLLAPHHLDVETVASLRNSCRRKELGDAQAAKAIARLAELRITRFPARAFFDRIWELRHNVTPYDAAYVAVAEALDVPLVTADRRLKEAPGPRCEIELLI